MALSATSIGLPTTRLMPKSQGASSAPSVSPQALSHIIHRQYCPPAAPLFADRFRLHGFLGAGGMGTVFKAEDTISGELLAVKITGPEFAVALKDEATVMGTITDIEDPNPNVVGLHSEGIGDTVDGIPTRFLALEYIDGVTLKDEIENASISYARALEIASQICFGLEVAAKNGIVHKDLKPENVMLDHMGQAAKVLDFGLAKFQPAEGCTAGTPHYMSPEQAQGNTLDERSDVYAVGLLLYEMIARRHPSTKSTPLEVMAERANQEESLPQIDIPKIPESGQQILNGATQANREDRTATIADLRAEIERELERARQKAEDLEDQLAALDLAAQDAGTAGPLSRIVDIAALDIDALLGDIPTELPSLSPSAPISLG